MSDPITITVHGDPVSWKRMRLDPRHRNARGIPRSFEDGGAKHQRARMAERFWASSKIADPKHVATKTSLWKLSAHFHCETFRRRDLDRLISLVMDAATDGRVYDDDSQVREFGKVTLTIGAARGTGYTFASFEYIGEDIRKRRAPRKPK